MNTMIGRKESVLMTRSTIGVKKTLLFLHFYQSGGSLNIVMHSLTYGGVHVRSNACLDIKSHRDHIA